MTEKARILLLDIETAPAKVFTWSIWDVNIGLNQIIEDKYVLMWAAKWLGKKEIFSDSVCNHTTPEKYSTVGEKKIAQSVWKLLDEADIVITHNGNSFDIKELNSVFLKHHLPPVSSFKSIDTKLESKKNFRFLSVKMEFLLKKLDIGAKLDNGGFELWKGCMRGETKAWLKMIRYCKGDVTGLERLYKEFRPFIKSHPNLALYSGQGNCCPNCAKDTLQKKGFAYTVGGKYQRLVCTNCGKNVRDTKKLNGKGFVNAT